jgi:hypothetical protein
MPTLFEFIKESTQNLDFSMKKWKGFVDPLREARALVYDRYSILPDISEDDGKFAINCIPQEAGQPDYHASYQLDFFGNRKKSEVLFQTFRELEEVYNEAVAQDRPLEYTSDPLSRRLGFQVFRAHTRTVYLIPLTALKTFQMTAGVQ